MVSEEDIKIMSRLAMYEKGKGKQDVKMNRYYKGDYVRICSLKAGVFVTISFIVLIAMIMLYNLDYILANVFKIDYMYWGKVAIIIYALVMLLYCLIGRLVAGYRYEKARPRIIDYNNNLKKLQELQGRDSIKHAGGVVVNDDIFDY